MNDVPAKKRRIMSVSLDARPEKGPHSELRPTTGHEIEAYIQNNWSNIEVDILPPGEKKTVESGWHGEGISYEARVDFGDLLTTPIAGTELSAPVFTEWLAERGFLFERGTKWLDKNEAAELLASEESSVDDIPIFRAWRRDGTPAQIEFYQGSQAELMQRLTSLGNRGQLDEDEQGAFSGIVANLSLPFLAKGTTKAAEHLGLPYGFRRIVRKDDCLAAGTTYTADKMISDRIDKIDKRVEPLFWVDDVVIATTQATIISILVSERYNVPLLMRAGAASFGLGGNTEDLNYMRNTQPKMLRYGSLTSGDFGDNMHTAGETSWAPALIRYGHGSPLRETRFFLRGGGAMKNLMLRSLEGKFKRHQGIVSIVSAKRIDHGPGEWSLIEDGIHAVTEDEFFPRYSIEPGATLMFGKQPDSMFRLFTERTIAQFVIEEDDFRVLRVDIGGEKRLMYEPLPATKA